MTSLTISEVNSLDDNQFETVFGNVIEHCKSAPMMIKKLRPFKNVNELCDAFQKYLDDINEEEKLAVLKSHPDLAGRLAQQGDLTPESTEEQRSAGLNDLTEEQKRIMDDRNKRYKLKFGFPFIICARENKVQSILSGLQHRYNNNYDQEVETGINEVKKICKLRILNIVTK
ncbi:2-oxo-4-hydroxy-4-carboxy-5-ureidoimidazoline decarboxylase [Papilio machaon]|uniref:2-oxo-4-hydroxy-4-carboxy-5-ureidoimidazoline decarboxylase n=1 Tax=Papilio machaon TaxID=76193 RepID=UPI001E665273|nr:2-oxo-4-hydroxy-4-carboxy-5-ureidoimidazoline decarboxylase [Papilio machaon]